MHLKMVPQGPKWHFIFSLSRLPMRESSNFNNDTIPASSNHKTLSPNDNLQFLLAMTSRSSASESYPAGDFDDPIFRVKDIKVLFFINPSLHMLH